VLNLRDATKRLQLERDLLDLANQRQHDALHDPLTGLPNRRSLFAALNDSIARARDEPQQLSLLLIDLDRFKEVNDTLGHHVGDQLLREFRPRLNGIVEGAGLLARLGGDEFAVLMNPGSTVGEAVELAQQLRAATERRFHYEGMTLLIEASVGIAIYPDHALDAEALLQRADIAMYAAKRGNLGQQIYSPEGDGHSRDNLALLGELPAAIASEQLILHYQPKFDLVTGEMRSVEALVRWQHPARGLLFPAAFLPMVEHTGMMRPLTLWILDSALAQAARWQERGLSIPVAVNLSAPDLLDGTLPADVAQRLSDWGVDASLLIVEITERIVAADPERVAGTLGQLRDLGVTVSLDDFGTGSSSLSYLRRLPVQELKVDRSFIRAAATGAPADVAILRTIVALAQDLDLVSVAEGIETKADLRLLRRIGCEQGQGYGLGRPMEPDQITALTTTQHVLAGPGARAA
jgi:diguanylate cyclase (GGDEF)-like protein